MLVRNIMLWVLAFIITVASAVYQRITGPTYPVDGSVVLAGQEITYKFYRSHDVGDRSVVVKVGDASVNGTLKYKPFRSDEPYTAAPMRYESGQLTAYLPHQPPAGKLLYHVELSKAGSTIRIPEQGDVRIRFTGFVPRSILTLHVFFIFLAMLVSTRAGLAVLAKSKYVKRYAIWTTVLLVVGGFIFGGLVQKYAFGVYWAGVPYGIDLTDNKTLIAFIAWLLALVALMRKRPAGAWALAASIVTFLIFLIPHSLLGS
ncbi:hypothetical protein JXO59_10675 [candidate division KSB1 bacterium]|nr:hypothetical protein [candidate division KSB1 bacterium]